MKKLAKFLGVIIALLLIAFVIFRTPDTDPAEMRAKYGGEPSKFVELEPGHTVHLRDEGPESGVPDAPVIVLLHGSGADLHTWEPWVKDLRADYRVIRFDQIAHGLTGPAADGQYGMEDYAEDVELVVDALGLDKFILAGSSMGGRVALSYALNNQEKLEGLVLVGGSGAPVTQRGSGNLAYAIVGTPGVRNIMKFVTPRSMIKRSFEQSISNTEIMTDEQVDRYWELLRYPGNRDAALERLSVKRTAMTAEQAAALDVPTLLIWGDEDALVPLEVGQWFAENLPNAKLVSYPGIGHLPHEEGAERSLSDLRNWLITDALNMEVTE